LQRRTHQGAATVAIINEPQLILQHQAVGAHALQESRDLTVNGSLLRLLIGRNSCIDGCTEQGRLRVFASHSIHAPWAMRWDENWSLPVVSIASGDGTVCKRVRVVGTANAYARIRICFSRRESANARSTFKSGCRPRRVSSMTTPFGQDDQRQ